MAGMPTLHIATIPQDKLPRRPLTGDRITNPPSPEAAAFDLGALVAVCFADSTFLTKTALAPVTFSLVLTLLYRSRRLEDSGSGAAWAAGESTAEDTIRRAAASDANSFCSFDRVHVVTWGEQNIRFGRTGFPSMARAFFYFYTTC